MTLLRREIDISQKRMPCFCSASVIGPSLVANIIGSIFRNIDQVITRSRCRVQRNQVDPWRRSDQFGGAAALDFSTELRPRHTKDVARLGARIVVAG
jgi:hypothetical protein